MGCTRSGMPVITGWDGSTVTETTDPLKKNVSRANPILYMVNAFRYGVLGVSDISIGEAYMIIGVFVVLLYTFSIYLFFKDLIISRTLL